jgi:hypothetical protein
MMRSSVLIFSLALILNTTLWSLRLLLVLSLFLSVISTRSFLHLRAGLNSKAVGTLSLRPTLPLMVMVAFTVVMAPRGFLGHPAGLGAGSSTGGRGRGSGDFSGKPKNKFPPYQICGKQNHSIFKCFKHFDPSMGKKSGNAVSTYSAQSYGVDTNWYADSEATNHVTNELDKLAVRDAYTGGDQIYTPVAQVCTLHILVILTFVLHAVIT